MRATQNEHLPEHKHSHRQQHILYYLKRRGVISRGYNQQCKKRTESCPSKRCKSQDTAIRQRYRVLHLADTVIDQVQRRDRVILLAEHVKSGERIIVTNEGGDRLTGGQGLALSLRQARGQI